MFKRLALKTVRDHVNTSQSTQLSLIPYFQILGKGVKMSSSKDLARIGLQLFRPDLQDSDFAPSVRMIKLTPVNSLQSLPSAKKTFSPTAI